MTGVVFLAVVTAGCKRASLESACPHDQGIRTYAEWQHEITFPYLAPEVKLSRLTKNYDRVGVGSSKGEIIEAFGPPDYELEAYPKVRNQSCIYEFEYYFEKPTDMANEFKDKRISVFFSNSGRARWIVGNVGLPDKGGPSPSTQH